MSCIPGLCSFGMSGIKGTGKPAGGGVTISSPSFLLGDFPWKTSPILVGSNLKLN